MTNGHGFIWLKINKLSGNCAPNYKANAKMMVFRVPKKPTALLRPKNHHFGVSFAIASKDFDFAANEKTHSEPPLPENNATLSKIE